jgi:hypothetical protein
MVGCIAMAGAPASGVHYVREGHWRFQKARNVVVAVMRSKSRGCS